MSSGFRPPGQTRRCHGSSTCCAVATGLDSVGIASFGPLELRPDQAEFGQVTNTTKPGWSHVQLVRPVHEALGVPVGLDTDVNGAALGEGRWGAARGVDDFVYLTVGTGIGGGAVSSGQLVKGLAHPEMGHVVVQRRPDDQLRWSLCLSRRLPGGDGQRSRPGGEIWPRPGQHARSAGPIWQGSTWPRGSGASSTPSLLDWW